MPKTHFLGRTPAVTVRASKGDARFVFTHVLEVADLLRELRETRATRSAVPAP